MKTIFNKFYYSRIGQYLIFAATYTFWWKFVSFEFAVICGISIIVGELTYKEIIKTKK